MKEFIYRLRLRIYYILKSEDLIIRSNVTLSKKCFFGAHVTLSKNSSIGNCEIGSYSYIGKQSSINNVKIGCFCSIGPNVMIGLGDHPTKDFISTSPYFYLPFVAGRKTFVSNQYFNPYKKINIGNDVWIGANVVITEGVTIGDGVIIAAGAVVTKDVEPYSIIGGVPAKLIRMRFCKDFIIRLLDVAWWNKDIKWIKLNVDKFRNISEFFDIDF